MEGLWRFVEECDTASFLQNYDFVLFSETFASSVPDSLFPSYKVIVCPGVKVSDSVHGRLSGGLVFLVRKELYKYVQQVAIETDNIVVLKISKSLTGLRTDCLLFGAYLPPENSRYYEETDIFNGVSLLEDCLLEIGEEYGDLPCIVCGDLNSRTGMCNSVNIDPVDEISAFVEQDFSYSVPDTAYAFFSRVSKDSTVNAFGRYLLNICEEFRLVLLNGLKLFNWQDNFTYISENGCSVIDYFVVSSSILHKCTNFKITPLTESKHAAVEMHLMCSKHVEREPTHTEPYTVVKYKWNEERKNAFHDQMSCDHAGYILHESVGLIERDFNQALSHFNRVFEYAGKCMEKTFVFGSESKNAWFDKECRQSKTVLRRCLHKFNRTDDCVDKLLYIDKRKEYKGLLKLKKKTHKQNLLDLLQGNLQNPKRFWDAIRYVRPKSGVRSTINIGAWFQHFYKLFNDIPSSPENDIAFHNHYGNDVASNNVNTLDQPITVSEIVCAINALKTGKASGPDGLIGEFYKNSIAIIMPFLHPFFNYLFNNGLFPDEWSVAVIQPLHKKGDVNQPDNYRGISLLDICSKLYTFILNKRLTDWIEVNGVLGEEQAGFRENRCTTDHVFTLMACIQKQLLRHRKLYVAFIDFKKAFDTVCREKPLLDHWSF